MSVTNENNERPSLKCPYCGKKGLIERIRASSIAKLPIPIVYNHCEACGAKWYTDAWVIQAISELMK